MSALSGGDCEVFTDVQLSQGQAGLGGNGEGVEPTWQAAGWRCGRGRMAGPGGGLSRSLLGRNRLEGKRVEVHGEVKPWGGFWHGQGRKDIQAGGLECSQTPQGQLESRAKATFLCGNRALEGSSTEESR